MFPTPYPQISLFTFLRAKLRQKSQEKLSKMSNIHEDKLKLYNVSVELSSGYQIMVLIHLTFFV
jgi:hypothetical protein